MTKGTALPPTELGTQFQSSPQSHTFLFSCYFYLILIFDQQELKLEIKMRQDSGRRNDEWVIQHVIIKTQNRNFETNKHIALNPER